MSELDTRRRGLLARLLRSGGQAVVTATEADHVPDVDTAELIQVRDGSAISAPTVEATVPFNA
jgi:recombinational DNA repair ATPase RecF